MDLPQLRANGASITRGVKDARMVRVNRSILLRVAILQAVLVGVLSAVLAVALGKSFFTHGGWIVGPAAWIGCSLLTARVLALPLRRTLIGAVLAGLPSLIAVAAGAHWLGDVAAIALFALWCARTQPVRGAAWGT